MICVDRVEPPSEKQKLCQSPANAGPPVNGTDLSPNNTPTPDDSLSRPTISAVNTAHNAT